MLASGDAAVSGREDHRSGRRARFSDGPIRVARCRVTGVIGREIHVAVLLPDSWNHKFLMGGGGGFVGTVQNQAQAVVNAGYPTAGTDTGRRGRRSTSAGSPLLMPTRPAHA